VEYLCGVAIILDGGAGTGAGGGEETLRAISISSGLESNGTESGDIGVGVGVCGAFVGVFDSSAALSCSR
jgi:hypothetical protein